MEQVSRAPFRGSKLKLGRSLGRVAAGTAAIGALSFLLAFPCRAADDSLEYRVKAAFLLNFVKFTEWPSTAFEDATSPLAICVLGDDPFGRSLDQTVEGEVVGGRKIIAPRIKRAPAPKTCQVLFVSKAGKDTAGVLSTLGPGVLAVGEGEGFLREGGMIAFVIEDRRVRFRANQAAAESAGLKLSSKLLSVAKSDKE